MNNKILKYLDSFRKIKANGDLKISLLRINILFLIGILILIIIESLFYLQPQNRYTIISYILFIYSTFTIYAILKYYFKYRNLFDNNSNESIASLIGDKFSNIKDKLINAYQLEEKLDQKNEIEYELSIYAINKVKNELDFLAVSFNKNHIHSLFKIFSIIIAFGLVAIISFNSFTFSAINRLANPQKTFKVLLPFDLVNLTEDNQIFNGDDKKVSIAAIGEVPESIILNYIIDDKVSTIKISHENEVFNYTFNDIQSNIIWWGNVYANSLFSSWDNIQSEIDTITVIKRPIISNLTFKIDPPSYTGLPLYSHSASRSNIKFPYGSNIIIEGISNKNLNSAELIINNDTLSFEIDKTNFSGSIILMETCRGSIICRDNIFNKS